MLKIKKNANINGVSEFEGVQAMSFFGSAGDDEYVNMNLIDMETYMAHISEVMQDQKEFMEEYQKIKEITVTQSEEEVERTDV